VWYALGTGAKDPTLVPLYEDMYYSGGTFNHLSPYGVWCTTPLVKSTTRCGCGKFYLEDLPESLSS